MQITALYGPETIPGKVWSFNVDEHITDELLQRLKFGPGLHAELSEGRLVINNSTGAVLNVTDTFVDKVNAQLNQVQRTLAAEKMDRQEALSALSTTLKIPLVD